MRPLKRVPASLLLLVTSIPTAYTECNVRHKGPLDTLYICGTVLTPTGPLLNGHIAIHSGRIHSIGPTCTPDALVHASTTIDCGTSIISPGFINTHEHIDYSTVRPLKDTGARVHHRHDWRCGTRKNVAREPPLNNTALISATWGELRHIFSGTTSIVGDTMAPGLARNLDFAAGLGGDLVAPAAVYDIFPLDDSAGILRNGDCDYGPHAVAADEVARCNMYLAHIAEGIDAEAANEFRCLSNSTYDTDPLPGGGGLSVDIVRPNVALVHALGLTKADFDLVAMRGAHVIWSPRSNVFLYGKTLDVSYLLGKGINVALGTDWLPSGSATMGREAICATSVMRKSYGVEMGSRVLWELMTINAAKAARFQEYVGSLEIGKLADIAVLENRVGGGDPYAQVVYGSSINIELVLRGGKVMVMSQELGGLSGRNCERVMFGEIQKIVCVADELGQTYVQFERRLGGVYPAIFPEVPPDEPSCEPTR
ncbi:hypothetical protein N0V90_001295 [Kalmusia sp. IMI 367209]|nr:hypothetical protein N0V90_001295 [Kalmusia sp. IMI 367209]